MRSLRAVLPAIACIGLMFSTSLPIYAAQVAADPLNTPQGGGLPDVSAIAQAYGELSVFVLNVAAGNDGRPRDPVGEQAFTDAFAQHVLAAYPGLGPERQQALSELPALRAELRQLWPTMPSEQRQAVQQEFAAGVEAGLSEVPCDVYDALARAYLLPFD